MINKFDDNKAAEIAALYNIPNGTVNVWKTRGGIPKKYFDENGKVKRDVDTSEKISDADKYRLMQILEMNEHLNLSELISTSIQKIADVKRGKTNFTKKEFLEIKKELINLKNKFEPVFAAKSVTAKKSALRELFKNPLLKPYTFAEGREHQYCIDVIMNKDYDPDLQFLEATIVNLSLFKQSIIL